jgi:hypothetical protein
MIPALLIGSIMAPVQSREVAKLAQLLDSASPQARNAEVIVGNFLTLMAEQKFQQAGQYLSPSLTAYGSTAQLQQLWQKMIQINGPMVRISSINATELLGTYTVIATVDFKDLSQDLPFTLDQNQKITEVNFLWLGNVQTNAEQFVNALAKGDYAVARTYLSPDLRAKFLPETMKQRWETLTSKAGSFKQVKGSSVIRNPDYTAVQLDVEFQNYSGKFFVFFNPLSQIIAINSPLQKR